MTDWDQGEGARDLGREEGAPEDGEAAGLPEGFDVSVMEWLVEAFPEGEKRAEQASVEDAEQEDQLGGQRSQFFILSQ